MADYFSPSTLRICIDYMTDINIEGRFYCKMIREPLMFANIEELLLKADELFDEKGFPQAYQQKRSFSAVAEKSGYGGQPQLVMTDDEIEQHKGKHATLDVMVNSRSHASWQGRVRTSDPTFGGTFEGEMELIKYINKLR